METALDWKTRVLRYDQATHQRLAATEIGARFSITDDDLIGLPGAEVWDLATPVIEQTIADLAATTPYTPLVAADNLPVPHGLIRFPEPVLFDSGTALTGVYWTVTPLFDSIKPYLAVSTFNIYDRHGRIWFEACGLWPLAPEAAPMIDIDVDNLERVEIDDIMSAGPVVDRDGVLRVVTGEEIWQYSDAIRYLLALHALARAAVFTANPVKATRSETKRSRRAGSTNDHVTRLTLPAAYHDSTGTGDGTARTMHWCRGHWRWQPVGEGRQDRRLTWIRPHVRGSVGEAPAAMGEKLVTIR